MIHWRGPPLPPGHLEVLARSLETRLTDRYRVPIVVRRRGVPYRGIGPTALARFAKAGIDDAVVVEASGPTPDGPFRGRVQVVALATQDVLHDLRIETPPGGGTVVERLQRFADAAYVGVSRRWLAPGDAPEMDPLRAANNLYRRRACGHAVLLYDLALDGTRPARADLIATFAEAEARRDECRRRLERERRIAEDASAEFGLEVNGSGFDARMIDTIRGLSVGLARVLKSRTDKPARLFVDPSGLTLTLRHHPQRAGQPALDRTRVAAGIDLTPLRPVFVALIEVREEAATHLPSDLALQLRNLAFRIRLEHLLDESLTFELVEVAGSPMIGPRLTVTRQRSQVFLQARSTEFLREGLFVLGPLLDGRGRPTEDALAVRFFEEVSTL